MLGGGHSGAFSRASETGHVHDSQAWDLSVGVQYLFRVIDLYGGLSRRAECHYCEIDFERFFVAAGVVLTLR